MTLSTHNNSAFNARLYYCRNIKFFCSNIILWKRRLYLSEKSINIGPDSGYDNYIMAIESSCDETACAIVKNGREVVAKAIVASQIKTHKKIRRSNS